MLNKKAKGSNAERELLDKFWKQGWACLRAAGSGSTKHACPDIIAGNGMRYLSIECKITSLERQYLTKKEIEELDAFARIFGCESWIAVKLNREWSFLMLEDLKETKGNNFSINKPLIENKSLTFEELIKGF